MGLEYQHLTNLSKVNDTRVVLCGTTEFVVALHHGSGGRGVKSLGRAQPAKFSRTGLFSLWNDVVLKSKTEDILLGREGVV